MFGSYKYLLKIITTVYFTIIFDSVEYDYAILETLYFSILCFIRLENKI